MLAGCVTLDDQILKLIVEEHGISYDHSKVKFLRSCSICNQALLWSDQGIFYKVYSKD